MNTPKTELLFQGIGNGPGNSNAGGLIVGLVIVVILIGLYFLPSIIASHRRHSNAVSIFVLNLFLGWTFLGWIAALIWAFSDNTLQRDATTQQSGPSNLRTWAFVAIFAIVVIVAVEVVTHREQTGLLTQDVAHPSAPTASMQQNEIPTPTIQAGSDIEGFQQSKFNPGFQTYTNGRYGFQIDCPKSFVPQQSPENGDGLTLKSEDEKATLVVWGMNNAGSTLEDEFNRSIKDVHGELGYNKLGKSWFVVTWTDGETMGYTKEFVGTGSQNAFTLSFHVDQRPEYESIVTTIEKSFKPGDVASSH